MGHERGRPLLQDAASFLASRDLSVEIFFDRLLIFLHLYVSFFFFFFKEGRGKKLFGKRLSRDE